MANVKRRLKQLESARQERVETMIEEMFQILLNIAPPGELLEIARLGMEGFSRRIDELLVRRETVYPVGVARFRQLMAEVDSSQRKET